MRKLAYLLGVLIVGAFAACSGGQQASSLVAAPDDPAPGPQARSEVLAQLEAMGVPDGVDAAVFAQLKEALRAILERGDGAKLVSTPPTGAINHINDLTSGVDDLGNKGIQWNYRNAGDYDFNSQVNLGDLMLVGVHFGKSTASADWLSAARFADGNKDGRVNIADVAPIGINFLRRVAAYQIEGGPAAEGPYTVIGQVLFSTGRPLLSGIRMYHYLPAVQHEFYRVVPVDEHGVRGEPSDPSIDFLISDKTRIIGAAGGPSFISRDGDNVTILLPDGGPSPIKAGDVVVGAEDGGYLLRVLDAQQVGNHVNVTGEPGILADVFLQGGLGQALTDISQVPPEVYTLNLAGQVLHDDPALYARITSGTVSFLPAADVAVNYNQYGGVTYLRGLALGGPLNLNMTVEVDSTEWSGDFPPTPAEIPFYEHKMTGYTFDFTAYQDGVPVTMTLQYDVYVGIRGTGNYFGTYIGSVISSYDNIKMGGIFNSQGTQDFNQFSVTHGSVSEPTITNGGGDFSFTAYVRPEIHTRLYGNPIPGNTEDLSLTLSPQLVFAGTRTISTGYGYDYVLSGEMDTSYKLELHHIGLDDNPQYKFFPGEPQTLLSGFIPDTPPG
jgi:hypothetical protein